MSFNTLGATIFASFAMAAGTTAATTDAMCVNVYAFFPGEQMISCSCPVTPNGLVSLSARRDLVNNMLTPAVPAAIVVKLYATIPVAGSYSGSASNPGDPTSGKLAWGTTVHAGAAAGSAAAITEPLFLPAMLNTGELGIGELGRLRALFTFINANGSGFGISSTCRLDGLGADRL